MEPTVELPANECEFASLLNQCVKLKKQLVDFACRRYHDEIRIRLRRRSRGFTTVSESDATVVVDDFIHTFEGDDGKTVIDSFLESSPDLSDNERRIVSDWKESIVGVFEIESHDDRLLRARNLVDELEYRLAASNQSGEAWAKVAQAGVIMSRVDRVA